MHMTDEGDNAEAMTKERHAPAAGKAPGRERAPWLGGSPALFVAALRRVGVKSARIRAARPRSAGVTQSSASVSGSRPEPNNFETVNVDLPFLAGMRRGTGVRRAPPP